MINLKVFNGFEIEMIELNGEILFNAKQVGNCLEIKNINKNIANMDNDEVIKVTNKMILGITKGYSRKLNNFGENFLTELGVYRLIFQSRKDSAIEFKKWVATVLKDIRQNGFYVADNKAKEYLGMREEGKVWTNKFKQTLYGLRQYAINQGSKHYLEREESLSQNYFKLLNSTVGIKTVKGIVTRDNLTQQQLMQVLTLENSLMLFLQKQMKKELHYTEIYKNAKQFVTTLFDTMC